MLPAIGAAIGAAAAAVDQASSLTQPATATKKKKTGIQPFTVPEAKSSMPPKASRATLSSQMMSTLISAQGD